MEALDHVHDLATIGPLLASFDTVTSPAVPSDEMRQDCASVEAYYAESELRSAHLRGCQEHSTQPVLLGRGRRRHAPDQKVIGVRLKDKYGNSCAIMFEQPAFLLAQDIGVIFLQWNWLTAQKLSIARVGSLLHAFYCGLIRCVCAPQSLVPHGQNLDGLRRRNHWPGATTFWR